MTKLIHFNGLNFPIPHLSAQNLKHYFGGDIQKFSEKLPGFLWSKYPKEKHLPGYNYLGPGTRLDIRLDESKNPKTGEEPINAIDQLAYEHDLTYQNSTDISERHKADIEMINGLKELTNLSLSQKLIKTIIIKLFRTKLRLGQALQPRASKLEALDLLNQETKRSATKTKMSTKQNEVQTRRRTSQTLQETQRAKKDIFQI